MIPTAASDIVGQRLSKAMSQWLVIEHCLPALSFGGRFRAGGASLQILVGNHRLATGLLRWSLSEDENMLVNVLEAKVGGIRVAAEYGALLAVGSPFPARSILGPNNFVNEDKTDVPQEGDEVGGQWECKQAVPRVLVYVCCNQAKLAPRHQDPVALLEDGTDVCQKAG